MFMTEATGVIANAGLGVAGIGAPTNVVSGDAAIGGWPMAIGISTITRWRGRRTSSQTSNMQIRRSNKSRRRRPAANMHLRLRAGAICGSASGSAASSSAAGPRGGRRRSGRRRRRRYSRRRFDGPTGRCGCWRNHRGGYRSSHWSASRTAARILFVAGRLLLPISVRPIRRCRSPLLQLNGAAAGQYRQAAGVTQCGSGCESRATNEMNRSRNPCRNFLVLSSVMLPSSSTRFGLNVTYASPPSKIIPSPTMTERRCCCASALPIAPGEVPVMKPGLPAQEFFP